MSQPTTGIQKYAYGLSLELSKLGYTIIFLCPKEAFDPPPFGECKSFGLFKGHLWEQFDLYLFAKINKINLLFNFGNTAPILFSKNFISIHDLSVFEKATWYSNSFKIIYRFIIPKLIKRAKHLSTVSEFSKSEIINKFPEAESKITLLYNGVYF